MLGMLRSQSTLWAMPPALDSLRVAVRDLLMNPWFPLLFRDSEVCSASLLWKSVWWLASHVLIWQGLCLCVPVSGIFLTFVILFGHSVGTRVCVFQCMVHLCLLWRDGGGIFTTWRLLLMVFEWRLEQLGFCSGWFVLNEYLGQSSYLCLAFQWQVLLY